MESSWVEEKQRGKREREREKRKGGEGRVGANELTKK